MPSVVRRPQKVALKLSNPFPQGIVGSIRVVAPPQWIVQPVRRLMGSCRAINEIVFALLFVVAVGLGPFAGGRGVDEARMRELVGRVVDRTRNIEASMTNHWILGGEGEPVRPRLQELRMPTLVLHGTEDPLFPYGHAQALAREIHGARLLPLPGVGHEMPPPAVWEVVVPAMLEHTAAS